MAMRLSGLMSGMDTESIIQQLVEAKKTKVTKAVKAQKSLKYKQDAWKDLNKQIVNLYNGPYIADGNKIKFGNMATTMMMGPQPAMEVEQQFLQFMNTADTYEISDSKLTIKNADGQEIVFEQVAEIPQPVNE